MSKVGRKDVEALLALTEQVHSPNNGVIAQLCRSWLAVDSAPVGKIVSGRANSYGGFHVEVAADIGWYSGQRVRLVADEGVGS